MAKALRIESREFPHRHLRALGGTWDSSSGELLDAFPFL